MLTLTTDLKAFAVKNLKLNSQPLLPTSSDEDFRKAISEAVIAGDITPAQLSELTVVKQTEAETRVQGMINASLAPVLDLLKGLSPLAAQAAQNGTTPPATGAPDGTTTLPPGTPSGTKAYALAGLASDCVGADSPELVRVKSVVERYNDNRTAATWDKSFREDLQKNFGGRSITTHCADLPYTVDMPTDLTKAIAGVWFKNMTLKQLRRAGKTIQPHEELTEHEKHLLLHIVHKCKFVGDVGNYCEAEGESLDQLAGRTKGMNADLLRKAALDDTTSGGLEAVPIEFDANFILTPLLNGEIFPYVDVTTVTRRRIEATKIGNVSMGWGTASGTAIPLFDTDSWISAFDNSIYPLVGAIELGLDFLSDSPLAIGNIVINLFGERYRQMMDDVIVIGNGTNQPEGVFNASGVSSIGSANGTGGPPTMGDYEALIFGVGKEYRQRAGQRAMWIGTDTSYKRARQIKVNASSDERRLYGMDKQSYRLEDYRYAISGASAFSNSKVGLFLANFYRMYRRQGLEVTTVDGTDWNLVRQNKRGIALRSRWGGALTLAGAFSKHTDMQS